jgi:hypothetical protein
MPSPILPAGINLSRRGNKTYIHFSSQTTTHSRLLPDNCSNISIERLAIWLKSNKDSVDFLKTVPIKIIEYCSLGYSDDLGTGIDKKQQITFEEAIERVRYIFWKYPNKVGRIRVQGHPSDESSWYDSYFQFFKHLPLNRNVNFTDILYVIDNKYKVGSKSRKSCLSAMKKLVKVVGISEILNQLQTVDNRQTQFSQLQTVTLDSYINWYQNILNNPPNTNIDFFGWLWVFSMQLIYGTRLHENFAIANMLDSFVTRDGIVIPALNDPSNRSFIIAIGDFTQAKTTTKTGFRLSRPMIPPSFPDLINFLRITDPKIPLINSTNTISLHQRRKLYSVRARKALIKLGAPFTQSHALRHLANLNGIAAGIPQEIRALSLGHSVAVNEYTYKKRQGSCTILDIFNSF